MELYSSMLREVKADLGTPCPLIYTIILLMKHQSWCYIFARTLVEASDNVNCPIMSLVQLAYTTFTELPYELRQKIFFQGKRPQLTHFCFIFSLHRTNIASVSTHYHKHRILSWKSKVFSTNKRHLTFDWKGSHNEEEKQELLQPSNPERKCKQNSWLVGREHLPIPQTWLTALGRDLSSHPYHPHGPDMKGCCCKQYLGIWV